MHFSYDALSMFKISLLFSIKVFKQDSVNFNTGNYEIKPINTTSFSLATPEDFKGKPKQYKYGQPIGVGNMVFSITSKITEPYLFKFNSESEIIQRVGSGLTVSEAGRFTNVMQLSKTDNNAAFAADAINAVMKEYVKYDVLDKRKSAKQMILYIKQQLTFINQQVDSSGNTLASYKTKNKITLKMNKLLRGVCERKLPN